MVKYQTTSDDKATLLELWGVWSTSSLQLLPGPLWLGVIVSIYVSKRSVQRLSVLERNTWGDVLEVKWLKRCTPVVVLRSLSGKYTWERYEPTYPPSYGLNSTTPVLLEGWAGIKYPTKVDMRLNKETKTNLGIPAIIASVLFDNRTELRFPFSDPRGISLFSPWDIAMATILTVAAAEVTIQARAGNPTTFCMMSLPRSTSH